MKDKLLIIDDDFNIHEVLRLYLEREGYDLHFASDGTKGLDGFRSLNPDLIVLDIMLPVINGWEVCQLIRKESNVPIIMLTSKDTSEDKLMGFDYGADDYVIKPFDPKEVVARIRALLKRAQQKVDGKEEKQDSSLIKVGNVVANLNTYEVIVNNEIIELKPKEIQLLFFLLRNPRTVFTREQLLDKVWGHEFYGETRTVDVHIKRIREKIGDSNGVSIKTIWGVGYKAEIEG